VPDILHQVLANALYPPSSRWPMLPPALDAWLARSCARMPDQRFRSAGEQVVALADILRTAPHAAIGEAATMLPMQLTPPHVTPPYVTPPYVQPVSYAPPAMTPGVGGSTNEPIMQTAGRMAPASGMGLGVKIALALAGLLLFVSVGFAAVMFLRSWNTDETARTFAPPPTSTPTQTAAATAIDTAQLEPLAVASDKPRVTPPPQVTATATATVTATATATATATHSGLTRDKCKANCQVSCVDATDGQDCLMKCLRTCPK
jgi:hypothetical protein